MFGTGPARAITKGHIAQLADEMQCHPADLEAIAKVESAGFGWFRDGRIKILPEPHVFYRELPKAKRAMALRKGLATKSYRETRRSGHYRRMGPVDARYDFFERMIEYDRVAAFRSISMGTYQIMGFNAELCGFLDAEAMWHAFLEGEHAQLYAFAQFLRKKGLVSAIQRRDFGKVERKYNGGGQGGKYAKRMMVASRNLRRGKWARYEPGTYVAVTPDLKPEPTPVEDAVVLSSDTEKTTGVGAVLVAVGGGFATAWDNGLWVLLSVAGAALAAFIIWRVLKRRSEHGRVEEITVDD